MRWVKFSADDRAMIEQDRNVSSLGELAAILASADYSDWLEGLGGPTCNADLRIWHKVGEFLKGMLTLPPSQMEKP